MVVSHAYTIFSLCHYQHPYSYMYMYIVVYPYMYVYPIIALYM